MSAYQNVLEALSGAGCKVLPRGDRARAQCPVHGSRGLTLSVRRDQNRAYVHCFAGCEDLAVLAEVGLELADLFDGPRDEIKTYVPRPATPWDEWMRRAGLTHWPDLEHVLDRMVYDQVAPPHDVRAQMLNERLPQTPPTLPFGRQVKSKDIGGKGPR